eukprot:CAMPEP_0177610036 /NCGR_PEP_ID=MMETSP0419_2-20121207/19511_1 /TAXON_ID=582737 /ORGANISM="Tetraselmis sp., Strain GSL018" /LENGTH=125 /DNA_ID=CAMNT_0019105207 /DNA_START=107 /DNA_END=481 /DNA_ORIENTATION=-
MIGLRPLRQCYWQPRQAPTTSEAAPLKWRAPSRFRGAFLKSQATRNCLFVYASIDRSATNSSIGGAKDSAMSMSRKKLLEMFVGTATLSNAGMPLFIRPFTDFALQLTAPRSSGVGAVEPQQTDA